MGLVSDWKDRAVDWTDTALGPVPAWPAELAATLAPLLPSPVPVALLWGESGAMLYNDAWARVVGDRHPRLLGRPAAAVWPELAAIVDPLLRAGLAGRALSLADRDLVRRRDGRAERIWVSVDGSPVAGRDGRPAGVLVILTETTARVRAERQLAAERARLDSLFRRATGRSRGAASETDHGAELRRERAHFAAALDHLPVGVWYVGKDGTVAYGNRAAKAIWGGERRVALDGYGEFKGWWRHSGRPLAPGDWSAARAVTRGETSLNEEIEIEAFDGVRRVILDSAIPVLDDDGEVSGAVVVNQDISRRVAVEDALREAKAEAERASLAKSKFLAAASHDLRQPVQSLMLFLAALKDGAAGTPMERPVAYMEEAVEALNVMLAGLLDLSRLDAGVALPRLAAVDLGDMVERVGREYAARAGERGLRLVIRPRSLTVLADAAFLERILRNLLENALRYTRSGGILVACRAAGDGVRLDVADTGVGIAPQHHEAVFDEYFQVGNEARDRKMGLGLGLAIVRRLAGLMGGRVELRSRPGRGSRFSLRLPAAEPVPAAPPATAADSGHDLGRGRSVLVVEDDEGVRASLRLMLESWGFAVVAADCGAQALERAAELPAGPDVIIADYRLRGGETGPQVARAVGGRAPRPVPTVIITGDTESGRVREVHAEGFLMLHKPVGADGLRRILAQALGGQDAGQNGVPPTRS